MNSNRRFACVVLLITTAFCQSGLADENQFSGQWTLTIDVPDAVPLTGQLDIQKREGRWAAWVENGPAPIVIEGNRIEVTVDSRDRQGFRFERVLKGTLEQDTITGVMQSTDVLETAAEFGEDGSSWRAVRSSSAKAMPRESRLAEFEGTWIGIRGVDLRKYTMDLTPTGQAWVNAYDGRMDEPQKRCVSPGLVAAATWIFPFEVLYSEQAGRLTMLYEAFGLSRRIYLNQTEMPEFYPESTMGYSRGSFSDGELIVETSLLSASTRDFNGEPVSDSTRIVERYFLSEDGDRLNLVMHMHDPDNYRRPPIRRRAWDRSNGALIFPFECDPDSFYRQLFDEGRMQEYIDRAHMRP